MARQQHSPEEKTRLVLEAIRGECTINEIAAENNDLYAQIGKLTTQNEWLKIITSVHTHG